MRKPENGNPSEPRNYLEPKFYRLIALLETVGKTFETILAKKMAYLAETYNLLLRTHMRGRQCISIEHAVHLLVEKILSA